MAAESVESVIQFPFYCAVFQGSTDAFDGHLGPLGDTAIHLVEIASRPLDGLSHEPAGFSAPYIEGPFHVGERKIIPTRFCVADQVYGFHFEANIIGKNHGMGIRN